jgi:general secretion pathway protein I
MNTRASTRPPSAVPRVQIALGFGLLEAIVALALLGGTGMALFSWIQQSTQAASRMKQRELETRLLLSAQALVDTVNPMLQPAGTTEVGDLRIQWQAEPLAPERRNTAFRAGVSGAFQMGLYRLDVHAQDLRARVEVRFEQWQIGLKRDTVLPVAPP